MRYRLFCLFSGLLLAWSAVAATASPDFRALAQDIQKRLDHAAELYAKQNAAEARAQVQGAYFEVFENLEGPIRINLSGAVSENGKNRTLSRLQRS